MSELSHFEQLSAQTPKKQPYAILIGALLVPIILFAVNALSPTEGVEELKKKADEQAVVQQQMDEEEL